MVGVVEKISSAPFPSEWRGHSLSWPEGGGDEGRGGIQPAQDPVGIGP